MIAILAGKILTPIQIYEPGVILVEDGKIRAVGSPANITIPTQVETIHAEEFTVAPGLIDLHTHGAAGASFLDGSVAGLQTISEFYASHGVTAYLATIGGENASMLSGIEAVNRYLEPTGDGQADVAIHGAASLSGAAIHGAAIGNGAASLPGAAIAGIHLEGPFINPDRPGAFTQQSILPPNLGLFLEYVRLGQGRVRLMTLAPELPGMEKIIRAAQAHQVVIAAGHSQATYQEMTAAMDWGVSHVTHTYNAMTPFNHREPGIMGAALSEDRLSAEIIADGIHVHPAAVRLLVRAKGYERICLITDSVGAAGLPDGNYEFEEQQVIVANHSVRLQDGTLCGSLLTMERGVENLVRFGAASLPQALAMASANPARVIGLKSKGRLASGMDADIIAFNTNIQVEWTMVGGRMVYFRSSP